MTELVVAPRPLVEKSRTIERLRAVRSQLPDLEPAALTEAVIWSAAIDAAARAKTALDVAREAAETRARAEFMLAKALQLDQALFEELSLPPHLGCTVLDDLGRVPDQLHELVLQDMLGRDLTCQARALVRGALRHSLRVLEPGIWRGYDDEIYIKADGVTSRSYLRVESLAAARHAVGLRRDPEHAKIDQEFSKARRQSLVLQTLAERASGERKRLIHEAELYAMRTAELLSQAMKVVE